MDYDDDPPPLLRRPIVLGLLAVAVIIGAVLAVGRPGGAHRAADPSGAAVASTTAPVPPATTASRSQPSTSPARGQALGPRWDPAGVLVGYRHDEGGAIAAAGNYLTALYRQANRRADRERAVLAVVAASGADADRMVGDLTAEDRALAALLGVTGLQQPGVIAYGRPVGYRVDSSSGDEVVVDVHTIGGQGVAGAPEDTGAAPREFAEVNRLRLVWTRGDWRLANWSRLVNGGPEPGSLAAADYVPFPAGEPQ